MGNLKYQLKRKLNSMKMYGRSKHDEKKDLQVLANLKGENISSVKVNHIFSKSTYKLYMDRTQKFGAWMQEKHPDIKDFNQIKKCHAEEYLLKLKEQGLRAATLQTYTAALAKVLNCNCNELNKQLPTKRSQTPQKGRKGTSNHFSIENHKDLIEFIKYTGLRASEAKQMSSKQIKIDKDNNVFLDFNSTREYQKMTKGGRGRIITKIRKSYQNVLLKIKETAEKNNYKTIWQKYSSSSFKNGNLHQYRRVYAQSTYNDILNEVREQTGYEAILDYHSRKYNEHYNRKSLKEVSQQLGHSRIDVVVDNYFR